MPDLMDQAAWQSLLVSRFEDIESDLASVQKRWSEERNTVPFSSYVYVIEYFLRMAGVDVSSTKIKCEGKSFSVFINRDGYDTVRVHVVDNEIRYYQVETRELSDEEVIQQRVENWNKYCKNHGFNPEDLYREFQLGSKYKIVGCKSRKQTFGILCYSYDKEKVVTVRTSAVLAALKKGLENVKK